MSYIAKEKGSRARRLGQVQDEQMWLHAWDRMEEVERRYLNLRSWAQHAKAPMSHADTTTGGW